mgnify:CR=1 FL=1
MKFSTVATLSLAATSLVAAVDQNKEYTTTKTMTTKYNHGKDTYVYTTTSTHTTHKYGKFNKTKKSHAPTTSGTYKKGRFNKTKKSHASTSSGTHKKGRFNKTKKSHASTSSGTHKYGKFNKTKHHSTLSGLPQVKHANAAAGSPSQVNSFQLFGLTAVSAFVTGALLLL